MSDCDTKSTEIQRLNSNGDISLNINAYYYYTQHQHDQILCKIIKFTSPHECLIIDLINMNEYTISKKHLSIIDNDTILIKAEKLNEKYLSKLQQSNRNENKNINHTLIRLQTNLNSTWVLTFCCLLLLGMAAICFYESSTYFETLKEYRRSTTTECNIKNYTTTKCQYECTIHDEIETCNGTQYKYYAITKDFCNGTLLSEAKVYTICPEKQIVDIGSIQTCFVTNCSDGFHFFPPYEHIDINFAGLIWMLIGYFIGCIGGFCGVYACGEYVQSLGTYDLDIHNGPREHHKCCRKRKQRENRYQTVKSSE